MGIWFALFVGSVLLLWQEQMEHNTWIMKAKVTLATEEDVSEIVRLICAHIDEINWPETSLRFWVRWFIDSKLCVVGIYGGKIITLMMGRPVLNIQLASTDHFYHDFCGDTWFVDCVINPCSLVDTLKAYMIKVLGGTKEKLAYTRRHGKIVKLHIYPLDKVLNYYATKS